MPAGIRNRIVSSFLRLVPRLRFLKFLSSTGLVRPAMFVLGKQRVKGSSKTRGLIAEDFRRSVCRCQKSAWNWLTKVGKNKIRGILFFRNGA